MTNFYERQLKRMFGDSEVLSADTVFAGKAMVSKISDDLRAKIEFVTARVSGQYEGLKLSIINKNEGLIDSQTFMFHEIIGLKGTARDRSLMYGMTTVRQVGLATSRLPPNLRISHQRSRTTLRCTPTKRWDTKVTQLEGCKTWQFFFLR